VIHKNRAWLHAREGTVLAQRDGTQIVVIAHAAKHQIGALHGQGRGAGTAW
jgi:hypothetical protein